MLRTADEVEKLATQLRAALEPHFSPATASPGTDSPVPSAGHCAATAFLLRSLLGGELVSSRVDGISHWFNRVQSSTGALDVDITGDQFARSPIQVGPAGSLYRTSVARRLDEVNSETRERARLLGCRAGLGELIPSAEC